MPDRPTLKEQIERDDTRPRVVAECVTLIDEQVKAKRGLRGAAIKTAYGAIKLIKRRFVPDVVSSLLPDWLDQLEPFYDEWQKSGDGRFSEFIIARSDPVAEALLSVTDGRAEKTKHKRARKYYMKHRDGAKENVIEAVPDLARIMERNLAPTE